jgi:hypothetical protein
MLLRHQQFTAGSELSVNAETVVTRALNDGETHKDCRLIGTDLSGNYVTVEKSTLVDLKSYNQNKATDKHVKSDRCFFGHSVCCVRD